MNRPDLESLFPWDRPESGIRMFHKDREYAPDGWIFVFGSNLAGRHGLGAAALAAQKYGAQMGQGMGRMGRSYAIPTKNQRLDVLTLPEIERHIEEFLTYARNHSSDRFWVTRVGCGLAGYSNDQIAPLFATAPKNCSFAVEWRAHFE